MTVGLCRRSAASELHPFRLGFFLRRRLWRWSGTRCGSRTLDWSRVWRWSGMRCGGRMFYRSCAWGRRSTFHWSRVGCGGSVCNRCGVLDRGCMWRSLRCRFGLHRGSLRFGLWRGFGLRRCSFRFRLWRGLFWSLGLSLHRRSGFWRSHRLGHGQCLGVSAVGLCKRSLVGLGC
jgi:hypothetical protein